MDNIPLPAYIERDSWAGFCEMRRSMPKTRPFTARAAKLILSELQKLKDAGHCPNAALDQSTMHSWMGVYAPKTAPRGSNGNAMSYRERDAEVAAARVHEMTGGLLGKRADRNIDVDTDAVAAARRVG